MTRTTVATVATVAWSALSMAVSALGYACGSSSDSTFSPANDEARGDAAPSAAAPGIGGATGAKLGPVDNAVILVHAAKSQPFRLCFSNDPDARPLPDSQVMPDANVVGVEVGSAVRLPPLSGSPGDVFLFDEPLIRAYYPAYGGAGKGPTCSQLLASPATSKLAVKLNSIQTNLSSGVHLMVLTGCTANTAVTSYSAAECGSDWTADKGNLAIRETTLSGTDRTSNVLPTQVIQLSQALENSRGTKGAVSVTFGPLSGPATELETVATGLSLDGMPAPARPQLLSFDVDAASVYDTLGFRVQVIGGDAGTETVLTQSLLDVQRLSSPRDVPSSYYSVASNYVLLVLGDPTLPDGGRQDDDLKSLHLLAVPVIQPSVDAGADAP